ncbi:cobalamin B12-binding domain-containing protein [Rhabdothermincola salaria]|uniref:cobalamin B12-binding domain-containing protein n=1 Tax=Rhabdothermincola salaria TaxID=2903142 RepID=UPI001E438C6D|nr:cobalamin-dependent protein [Rhabdothermincola salaria]MCD9623288.1 cobalamin-dependent protein [Rhabdothermincola salaria]
MSLPDGLETQIGPYLDEALRGDRSGAWRRLIGLYRHGVPPGDLVEMLAESQREVGERWYRNELSVADEHVASGVSAATLAALALESAPDELAGHTLVACAEGEWHSLPAEMLGHALEARGVGVTFLGASTPAEAVVDYLSRHPVDALAISCSFAVNFPGVARLVDAAHARGVPVLAGGRAFGTTSHRADRLGVDAWTDEAEVAATILKGWRDVPPTAPEAPVALDRAALELLGAAPGRRGPMLADLDRRLPETAPAEHGRNARLVEDMVTLLQHLAAAWLVDDDSVLEEFVHWMRRRWHGQGVSTGEGAAAFDVARTAMGSSGPEATRLLEMAVAMVVPLAGGDA